MAATPYFREAGSGPGVVCLHANSSSSSQWRALMEALAPNHHVLAVDSYGSGRSPAWPFERRLWLADEAALAEPVFERAGNPFALVGHSYGGAIALIAALAAPRRVRAMALYEPTPFSLIDAHSPPPNDADGIRNAAAAALPALAVGDRAGAAREFIDFWMGAGSWEAMGESRQAPILASIDHLSGWGHALFHEPTPLERFAELEMPILYMTGTRSPMSSLGVAKLLIPVLPRVEVVEFEGLGHMGPVTHPHVINRAIVDFLARHQA
jgi:pimeloyl-ACP methyl ester carboxylesterase